MLQTERMSKVTILSTQTYQKKVIDELHKEKAIDIIQHRKDQDADIGTPLENGAKVSELLVHTRSLLSQLGLKKAEHALKENPDSLQKIEKSLNAIQEEVNRNLDAKREREEAVRQAGRLLSDLKVASAIDIPLEAFGKFKSMARFVGHVKDPEKLAARLSALTPKNGIYIDNKGTMAAVFVASGFEKETKAILDEEGFSEIPLSLEGMEGSTGKRIREQEKAITQIEIDLGKLRTEMSDIRAKWQAYLHSVEWTLTKEAEKSEVPLTFAATGRAFMVTGWVQKRRAEALKSSIESITKGKCHITIEDPGKKDDVPIQFQNKRYSRPFEVLLDLYALPGYREIDPTFLMFLTFPLLFGFMLGDWGYGLTTLILFLAMKKAIPAARKFWNILILSSVSTIFFGILFGEFFGAEVLFGHDMWRVLSRTHQIDLLLYIAIGIGFVHVNWGIWNGFLNEKRNHGLEMAILAKGSWFVLEAVVVMIVLSAMHIWLLRLWVSLTLLIIPILMIYKGEGITGLVEIPGLVSNILSYARLMAIGIASVKLAEVVNEFAGEFFHGGGIGILWAVLILIVGHTINIALGLLGPFLHSLRLHYVEYFGKFFKGGAKRFKPFGARE